jgi:hypothetical protein
MQQMKTLDLKTVKITVEIIPSDSKETELAEKELQAQ